MQFEINWKNTLKLKDNFDEVEMKINLVYEFFKKIIKIISNFNYNDIISSNHCIIINNLIRVDVQKW